MIILTLQWINIQITNGIFPSRNEMVDVCPTQRPMPSVDFKRFSWYQVCKRKNYNCVKQTNMYKQIEPTWSDPEVSKEFPLFTWWCQGTKWSLSCTFQWCMMIWYSIIVIVHNLPQVCPVLQDVCHRGKKGKRSNLWFFESTLDQGSRYGFNIDFAVPYSHLKNAMKALAASKGSQCLAIVLWVRLSLRIHGEHHNH